MKILVKQTRNEFTNKTVDEIQFLKAAIMKIGVIGVLWRGSGSDEAGSNSTSETIRFYKTTRCNIPQDNHFKRRRHFSETGDFVAWFKVKLIPSILSRSLCRID
jgi:hypothetical protein